MGKRPHQFHLNPLTSLSSSFRMDARGQYGMPLRIPHPIVMRELLRRGVGIYGIESRRGRGSKAFFGGQLVKGPYSTPLLYSQWTWNFTECPMKFLAGQGKFQSHQMHPTIKFLLKF